MQRSDLTGVIDVADAAFVNDELFTWLAPRGLQYPSSWRAYMGARQRLHFTEKGVYGFVYVDDNDEVLGFAWWERKAPRPGKDKTPSDVWARHNTSWAEIIDQSLMQVQNAYYERLRLNPALDYGALKQMREDHDVLEPLEKATPHWYLAVLGVHPKAQRRGIGGMLLDWGLQRAREETEQRGKAVPVTMTSSPAGQGLYIRKGFRIVAWQGVALDDAQNFEGGAALVYDPSHTWIKPAAPGSNRKGRPIHVDWTSEALAAAHRT